MTDGNFDLREAILSHRAKRSEEANAALASAQEAKKRYERLCFKTSDPVIEAARSDLIKKAYEAWEAVRLERLEQFPDIDENKGGRSGMADRITEAEESIAEQVRSDIKRFCESFRRLRSVLDERQDQTALSEEVERLAEGFDDDLERDALAGFERLLERGELDDWLRLKAQEQCKAEDE